MKRWNIGKWIFLCKRTALMTIIFAVMFDVKYHTHIVKHTPTHTLYSVTLMSKPKIYMTLINKEKFLTPVHELSISCKYIFNYIYSCLDDGAVVLQRGGFSVLCGRMAFERARWLKAYNIISVCICCIYTCAYVKSPPHTIRILFLVHLAVDPINVNSPFDPSRVRNEPCAFRRKTTLKPKQPANP